MYPNKVHKAFGRKTGPQHHGASILIVMLCSFPFSSESDPFPLPDWELLHLDLIADYLRLHLVGNQLLCLGGFPGPPSYCGEA